METSEATFQFDGRKVATINLDQFMQSGRLVDPSVDIEEIWYKPHEFFALITNLLEELNIEHVFGPVYVSQKGFDYLADPLDKTSPKTDLKRCAFSTLVTRINLVSPDVADKVDFHPAIGIGFIEQGVQVCIGTNVTVCDNMSIFGEYFMQSYGTDKMDRVSMFDELRRWLLDVNHIHAENMRIIGVLSGIPITSKGGIQKLIGQLSLARELQLAGFQSHAPLDKDEIAEFQKRIIGQYGNLLENEVKMDLCELYNICTNILTHSEKNLHNKWQDIFEMGEFICEHYDVFDESGETRTEDTHEVIQEAEPQNNPDQEQAPESAAPTGTDEVNEL